MKKNEMTWQVMLIEAVGIVSAIAYLGLQIYYGIAFHVNPVNLMMNLVFMILVYVGLTLLAVYPERVNGQGRHAAVRSDSIRFGWFGWSSLSLWRDFYSPASVMRSGKN